LLKPHKVYQQLVGQFDLGVVHNVVGDIISRDVIHSIVPEDRVWRLV